MLSKPAPHPSQMRRFILFRTIDPTGVSGTGVVAEGLVFTDGLSILHWLCDPHATGIYPSLEDILSVHGHEGCTRIHFLDRAEILPIPRDFLK